jgi:glycosyltransferase involved in cell wall biosynthesis
VPEGPVRVLLNNAVLGRGTSGSATAVTAYQRALVDLPGIQCVERVPEGSSRRCSVYRLIAEDFVVSPVRSRRFDALISGCNAGVAWPGVPHLLVMYDTMVLDLPEAFPRNYRLLARATFGVSARAADVILTCSRASASRIQEHWPECEHVPVLPLPNRRWPVAPPRQRPPERPRALVVGVTMRHKNQGEAIRAVGALRRQTGVDVGLDLVGPDGPAEADVQAIARREDPDGSWITRRGVLSAIDLAAAFDAAWVLIQPSLYEGFGLPVIESGAAALPVVHSGRGSLAELNPAGDAHGPDAEALLPHLVKLLDADEYAAASVASRETALRHTPERFGRSLRAAIDGAVSRRAS